MKCLLSSFNFYHTKQDQKLQYSTILKVITPNLNHHQNVFQRASNRGIMSILHLRVLYPYIVFGYNITLKAKHKRTLKTHNLIQISKLIQLQQNSSSHCKLLIVILYGTDPILMTIDYSDLWNGMVISKFRCYM